MMNPLERFANDFKLVGTVFLDACPVCGSAEIGELWRLPQNRMKAPATLSCPGTPMHNTYLHYLPTLETPQSLFKFDICGICESIFLNPKSDDQAVYARDESKVRSFREKGPEPFRSSAKNYLNVMPKRTKFVVDAACGAGQSLYLMREARSDIRYLGLELSKPSVAFMNDELGIEAHEVDLDRDDLDGIVTPGTVDFAIVQEAYEHVRSPVTLLKKMARMLRPGGRMWVTAQFWGDNGLQIRVGEPIYINDKGFNYSVEQAGLDIVEMKKDIKIRALLEKPAG